MAEALAAKHPEIALVCHEKNQGPHASFNEGIDLARADYMMILCSDDLLSAGALSRAVGALEANPTAVLAFGPETNTDEYRAERWRSRPRPGSSSTIPPSCAGVFARSGSAQAMARCW